MKKIVAIIPARGGSKRLENKNIYPLNGKPLIAYTIEQCKLSKYVEETYVSSDSDEILNVAKELGVIPLKRSSKNSDDKTPKIIAIREAYEQLSFEPEIIVIPQANSPEIHVQDIDAGFKLLLENNLWEVMSADTNGIQNAAFRIVTKQALFNDFLSAHCGFITTSCLDVHTIDDIKELEKRLR